MGPGMGYRAHRMINLSPLPKWLSIAELELGVSEVAGKGANPRIVEYQRSCPSLPEAMKVTDETAWCSAFANWCMHQAGFKGTGLANARSWLTWGEPISLKAGAVAVLSSPLGAEHGHVAFVLAELDKSVVLLGGNQGNRVSITTYPRDRLLAYRWPSVAQVSP